MGIHLVNHVDRAVEKEVWFIDGAPYHISGWRGPTPLVSRGRFSDLYIHPKTGILCRAPRRKKEKKTEPVSLILHPENPRIQYREMTLRVGSPTPKNPEYMTSYWVAILLKDRPETTRRDIFDETVEPRKFLRTELSCPGRDAFFEQDLSDFTEEDSLHYYGSRRVYAASFRKVTEAEKKMIEKIAKGGK